MANKHINLLKKQLNKLDFEDFDLEAWKGSTVALLEQIYGTGDIKAQKIESLHIDYSSWALRDANASYNPLETCKNQGREILNMAIDTLDNLGLPELSTNDAIGTILDTLENELKVSQFTQLNKILGTNDSHKKKNQALVKVITSWGPTVNANILATITAGLNLHNYLK